MGRLLKGWRIQTRVIGALMIRELTTRFGRENIGFLWIMVEPLMFAVMVGVVWRVWRGPDEYGIHIISFVVTGYLPLMLFRHGVSRSVGIFSANSSLMYHRQIKLLDFILVRFLIELIGSMMAFLFIGVVLNWFGIFPVPHDLGSALSGWFLYCYFTFSLCLVLGPVSEMSELLEKIVPVTTYVMVPFSGTFSLMQAMTPAARNVLIWSPPITGMELMRYGIFGNVVHPYYNIWVPLTVSSVLTMFGLVLCRWKRRTLVVE